MSFFSEIDDLLLQASNVPSPLLQLKRKPAALDTLREQCKPSVKETPHKPKAITDVQLLAIIEDLHKRIDALHDARVSDCRNTSDRFLDLEVWRRAMFHRSFFSRLFGRVK